MMSYCLPAALLAMMVLFVCVVSGWTETTPAGTRGLQMYTRPPLPLEGRPFHLVVRAPGDLTPDPVRLTLSRPEGSVVVQDVLPVTEVDGALEASLQLTIPHNGLFQAEAELGDLRLCAPVPVLSPKREVNLIYYAVDLSLLTDGTLRWMTLVTHCAPDAAAECRRRGITPLRWSWGSNYISVKEEELRRAGQIMTPQIARETGRELITAAARTAHEEGYAGLGMDEFGGYAATDFAEHTKGFVRGILDARPDLPEGCVLLAWHGGPYDTELLGLYKQAVEFLVPEAYLGDFVPSQLGTELVIPDLAGRLAEARFNDMFTAPYGTRCRIIPALDLTDNVPVGEVESFIRILRREFPEVRGIAFFNVYSAVARERYRSVDALCFDYFIRPVITLQPDSLYLDRYGTGKLTAWVSNIGAIDSGPVGLRLLADNREVARATLPTVPAGYSRADNRTAAVFEWRPRVPGTFRLRVEVTDADGATVLEPATEVSLFLRP